MRKLVVSEFMTLDGVMQAPGGVDEDTDGGFAHGAWTLPYWHDDIGAYLMEGMQSSGAFLLGRRTWEGHGEAFNGLPEGDPFGDVINSVPKYVVSTTLTDASAWRNTTIIAQDVVEQVRGLKAQPGKDIGLDGSSVLLHTLARHGLVDEYRLLVYPIVLGSGKKVFGEDVQVNLRLEEARPFPSGVVLMRYAVERPA